MNPRVANVLPLTDFRLELTFRNGEKGIFDCRPHLEMPCMENLRDPAYFSRATVCRGTVVWPEGEDICPDELYECSDRPVAESEGGWCVAEDPPTNP